MVRLNKETLAGAIRECDDSSNFAINEDESIGGTDTDEREYRTEEWHEDT